MLERVVSSSPAPSTASRFQTRTEQAMMGNPWEVGHAHERLGVIAFNIGQPAEALKHLNIALAIYTQHDLVAAMAQVCGNLGAVYTTKADHTLARSYYQRSRELAERMGDLP